MHCLHWAGIDFVFVLVNTVFFLVFFKPDVLLKSGESCSMAAHIAEERKKYVD